MEELLKFKKNGKLSAQSFIIVSNQEKNKTEEELITFLESELIQRDSKNFPDLWRVNFPSFGIAESRLLKEKQSIKSLSGKGRYFILKIDDISLEAQNALLKTLEEPAEDCYFFIISSKIDIFLPTLLSRCQIIDISKESQTGVDVISIDNFLKINFEERLFFIKNIPDDKKNNREYFFQVLNSIEILLADNDLETKKSKICLEIILKARKYLKSKRLAVKVIWEYLALNLSL